MALVCAEWEHTMLTVNYTSHCVSVFTVKCENGRFQGHGAFQSCCNKRGQ